MQTMFQSEHGDRPYARNIGLLLVDGESIDKDETAAEARKTRSMGIDLLSVGINRKSIRFLKELKTITTDPDDKNVIHVDDFDSLINITEALVKTVCNGKYNHLITKCLC